jgi:hypothetical protein
MYNNLPMEPNITMSAEKIDDNTISATKTETTSTTTTYTYDYLITQRDAIQAQKDSDNVKRDAELTEVNDLIDKADKMGVIKVAQKIEEINP